MKKLAEGSREASRSEFTELEQLPNVGPAVAGYLRRAGVTRPQDLRGRDPYAMYAAVCRSTGTPLDPCLLDTFIAAVRFMGARRRKPGGPTRPNASGTCTPAAGT